MEQTHRQTQFRPDNIRHEYNKPPVYESLYRKPYPREKQPVTFNSWIDGIPPIHTKSILLKFLL